MRRFAFPFGFMVQGKGILVIRELFGGKLACGVPDGFRRRTCGHGQHDVQGFAVFALFGNTGFLPLAQQPFYVFFAIQFFARVCFQLHLPVAGNIVQMIADAAQPFGVLA